MASDESDLACRDSRARCTRQTWSVHGTNRMKSSTDMDQSIKVYWVPRFVLERTWHLLRQDGRRQVESTVLWGGRRFGDQAVIWNVLYPSGHDVERHGGFLRTGPDTTAAMGRWLRQQDSRGLIQVHSHPGSWIGHSKTDDDFPIASSEGFVSIVWPSYGESLATLAELGVHQLEQGKWRTWPLDERRFRLRLVETEAIIWPPPSEDIDD
jgi:hypothetical protein